MYEYTVTAAGVDKFEMSDDDAVANMAWKVLGDKKYEEVRKKIVTLPKGIANDRLVDEVFRVLNHPLVRFAMRLVR